MLIATWNVNGIRARQERVLAWMRANTPDALCLQEIKCQDQQFPRTEFEALGYEIATYGQKAYNGVAILARGGLADIERGFADGNEEDPSSRLIAATVQGVRIVGAYFPNGQEVGTEPYAYKLGWMDRLRAKLAARVTIDASWVLCGDFNVAPTPADVYDPAHWEGKILNSEPEREGYRRLLAVGFTDAFRKLHPTEVSYTWWDYRDLGFPKNKGMRLDHLLLTAAVADRLETASVDREERKGQQPSDHAPVMVVLRDG